MSKIHAIIQATITAPVNAIWYRGNNWYEVSYGNYNNSAYAKIVDDKIVELQFD